MSDSVQENEVESGKSLKNDHTMPLEEEAAGMDPKKTKDSQMVTTTSCSLSAISSRPTITRKCQTKRPISAWAEQPWVT